METVVVILSVGADRVDEFEAGFREHELPVWRDLQARGLLVHATLSRMDISTRPVKGATQYLVSVIFASGEGHHAHDAHPGFEAWNAIADTYQVGRAMAFGGETVWNSRRRPDEARGHRPAGLGRRVRRLGPARRLAAHDRGRAGSRSARVRVHLAVRPFPHRSAPDRRDHVRVVHLAVGAGRGDRARPARARRDLHGVSEPGPHREDDLHDGLHQRRPDGARDRGRLEARRVAGLRLRLPRDQGTPGAARR